MTEAQPLHNNAKVIVDSIRFTIATAIWWTFGNGLGWFLFLMSWITSERFERAGKDGAIFLQILFGFVLFSLFQWLPIRRLHPNYLKWVVWMVLASLGAVFAVSILQGIINRVHLPSIVSVLLGAIIVGLIFGWIQSAEWKGRTERIHWTIAYSAAFGTVAALMTVLENDFSRTYSFVVMMDLIGVIFGIVSSAVLLYLSKFAPSNAANATIKS